MSRVESRAVSADDVVLTGLSGRLPDCANIEEFAEQLFAGVDLVTCDDRRWTPGKKYVQADVRDIFGIVSGLHGLPERNGKLKDLAHFDATFFGVHAKQAHLMDPQLRMLLEITHETLIDAGINPTELRGSRTGVYIGVSGSESNCEKDVDKINGYALVGCSLAMFANRISYTFDFKGQSYVVDTGCSSSMVALSQAVEAIRAGHCDSAIVAGSSLCLNPITSISYHRLNMLSLEGRCAAFDAKASGFVRSEAVVAVLLQRRGAARRVYATVRGARLNNDGRTEQGITFPSGDMQRKLAQETFQVAGLRPQDVVYIEAHGTGTKVGDPQEVNAIAEFFCKDRQGPLLLGSVKSNMGHSEPVAGLCSIAKVVIAMQSGVIPANLHYQWPNPEIPALIDGRIQVVTRNTKWDGGLVAVNSFGFGGTNAHVILESEKDLRDMKCQVPNGPKLPRLVLASGRTEKAVLALLRHAQTHRDNDALHALLDAVHTLPIPGHTHRGYCLLADPQQQEVQEIEDGSSGEKRPLWFMFSGMGSQWPGMARSLMALPVFAASIARSALVLLPHDIDLLHVLTEADERIFDNPINSFVSITAVQVALVDVLREVGITPDGIVGASVGEVGGAYADGALTAEQAVLCAYWRGRSIVDAELPLGALLTVGLTWEEAQRRCPLDVELACHNAKDNVTVAGPVESLEKFAAELTAEEIFTHHVNSSGVAFHSKYIAAAAPLLRKSLETVIPQPKPRSTRWVTSALSEDQLDSDMGKFCSAEYFVNNLVSPVWLVRAFEQVPAHAVVVELAPNARWSALLRRELPHATSVPLVRRDAADALHHLLAALGKLFAAGCQPCVGRLYPPVPWPVPRGTPSLASHVGWDHSLEWNVAKYGEPQHFGVNVIEIDLSRAEDAFIAKYNIDGKIIFPAAGYLMLVWRTMAKLHNKKMEKTCIVLEDVQIHRVTIMSREAPVQFMVNIQGSGNFEVYDKSSSVVCGTVRLADERTTERLAPADVLTLPTRIDDDSDLLPLNTNDIYKELRLRGYNYGGVFCGICTCDPSGTTGQLTWFDNWMSFMDTMLQFVIIGMDTRDLHLCTRLQRVVIDPIAHVEALAIANDLLQVQMNRDINVILSGGVEMRGIKTSLTPRCLNLQPEPKLEKYEFVPYDTAALSSENALKSERDALAVGLQLVLENAAFTKVKIMEAAFGRTPQMLLLPLAIQVLESEPLVCVDAVLTAGAAAANYASLQDLGVKVTDKDVRSSVAKKPEYHVVLAANVLSHDLDVLPALAGALAARGALLLQEPLHALDDAHAKVAVTAAGLVVLSRQVASDSEFVLLGRRVTLPAVHMVLELTSDNKFAWLPRLQAAMQLAAAENSRLYLWSREWDCGILGLATCLRGEVGGCMLRVFYLPGARATFAPDAVEYAAQVQKDLAVNVLRAGAWGCYRHLHLTAQTIASPVQVNHAYVEVETPGDLSSLRWTESELRHSAEQPLPAGTDLCHVYYAPINFRDVMLATGKLPTDALPCKLARQEFLLGQEFSGLSSRGERVMGIVRARGMATSLLCDESFLWRVPDGWSLEEAATVPVAYATAYYALAVRGRMRRGEAVLVHAGAGSVGQAAIAIALHAGCTVFTTVSAPAQRAFLLSHFSALCPEHVGNSRDTSFEQLVMRCTHGRGVDLVLNSLVQHQLFASVRCLAEGGRFLELGTANLFETALSLSVFLKKTTIHVIMLDALFDATGNDADKATVVRCVSEGIAIGAVRPLPATAFSTQQLEDAFRSLATGEHVGKVVLRVREEGCAATLPVYAMPRTYMKAHKSYVLVGGLGGFGLELGSWLVKRGARHLVLVSRSGIRSGYQARCVQRWRQAGVRVHLSATDVSKPEGARLLLRAAQELAPIAGLFNLAAVLQVGFLENLTKDSFSAVGKPKIDITRALDIASRELVPELEHFVVFSSVVCGRGIVGQSNYGLANSVMERMMEQRQADGLPGLAIQWGAIDDVGLMVEATDRGRSWAEVSGLELQCVASCLSTLESLLALPHSVIASTVVADKYRQASTTPIQDIVHSIANILGIKDLSKVSQTASLAELGMDSLMSAEAQNKLEHGYGVVLREEVRRLSFARLYQLCGGGAPAPFY